MTARTISQLKELLSLKIGHIYPQSEIDWHHRHLSSHCCDIEFSQIPFSGNTSVTETQFDQYIHCAERLALNEPLQYILGYTEFYDCRISVRPGVLIPRPETEEIVHHVASIVGDQKLNLLDIGTGSGCIAVALAHKCPHVSVSAWDISPQALEIANGNALSNGVNISFSQVDILQWQSCLPISSELDVIVSNPPYILNEERSLMNANVLEYEPQLALFVPDDEPLLFYIVIAQFASHSLRVGGMLFFEINERFALQTSKMLAMNGFSEITVFQDMQAKDRWISCVK